MRDNSISTDEVEKTIVANPLRNDDQVVIRKVDTADYELACRELKAAQTMINIDGAGKKQRDWNSNRFRYEIAKKEAEKKLLILFCKGNDESTKNLDIRYVETQLFALNNQASAQRINEYRGIA